MPALELVCKLRVIDLPGNAGSCRLQIVYVNAIGDDVVSEIVRLANHIAALDAATGHPHRKAPAVMVAAVIGIAQLALAVNGASEFPAPDDQGVVEKSALLQVGDQRGSRLIGALALQSEIARQVTVLVPSAMVELNESHVALGKSPREQAVRSVSAGLTRIGSIHFERAVGLLLRRSIWKSGIDVCIRYAISYWPNAPSRSPDLP